MEFFTIALSSITPPEQKFSDEKVAKGAELIERAGGLIKPLILENLGFDPELGDNRYELIDGALGYWSAIEYEKNNPRDGEDVNAMVVSDRDIAAEQAEFF